MFANDEQDQTHGGQTYLKLIELDRKFYNPEVRVISGGKGSPIIALELNGSVYVKNEVKTASRLKDINVSYLSGIGHFIGANFLFAQNKPSRSRQYLMGEDEKSIDLPEELQSVPFEEAMANARKNNTLYMKKFTDVIVDYFKEFGKKVYVELSPNSVKGGPIFFDVYEVTIGEAYDIVLVTKRQGIFKIFLRITPNTGYCKLDFEPPFVIDLLERAVKEPAETV